MTQLIHIEKGSPDPDELAAVTAVLLALAGSRAGAAAEAAHEPRPAGRTPVRWRHREHRGIHPTGRGWRGEAAAT
ncbi:acyl-CoA carboxylase subunit epsilon [Streptomyces sp. NPDC058646]|uniref:acyl-CoA carboxylase subunit epsilon n=1 Tax=Streptomyces sp. NPDC058646 TaxID=3346574 RepID=UPI003664672A